MGKKKPGKKKVKKHATNRVVRHEIVVRTADAVPTTDDLAQPMKEGKELALPKTWVSDKQIMRMVQQTPEKFVYTRPAKGGGTWKYVTGAYVEKVLNFVFGFMWDFEIMEHGIQGETIWVKGKLTVKDPKGHTITKMQFGRADIKMKRDGKGMLDFGNDLKAASTDALKKCASLLGIASDIYGTSEYKSETGKEPQQPSQPAQQAAPVAALPAARNEPLYCHGAGRSGCAFGNEVTESEAQFSKNRYGKILCRECQKEAKPLK